MALSIASLPPAPQNVEDLHIIKFEQCALRLGMSLKNFERIVSSGKGPRVTKLSSKNRGIRSDHWREWLDARAEEIDA
jgi:hypothetical protein